MQTIAMARGGVALVDDQDYPKLSKHSWYANEAGYAVTSIGGKLVRMHRLILGVPAGVEVDHKNGNRLDNQRHNLRRATHAENLRNQRPHGGSSRFKGVSKNKKTGKWEAYIYINYKRCHLGLHVLEEDAARAYDTAAETHFGAFALTNRELGLL